MTIQSTFHRFPGTILIVLFLIMPTARLCAQTGDTANVKAPTGKSSRIFYGQASFYANKFHGRRTANGETFSQEKLTAACNVLPLGTWIRVTNLKNGKVIIVKTNDRLHPNTRRLIDLTRAGAKKLDFISRGLTRVKVEVINKRK